MGSRTVTRKAGSNLASVIARSLVKDPCAALLEFVSNSYDADAEKVRLEVNTLDDRLLIEDDGTGMDENSIENFYRMGDSEKRRKPVTAKGRRRIGQWGIATVLMEYLAGSYTLETWKDGQKVTVEEDFRSGGRESFVTDDPEGRHGTRIVMRDLNFDDTTFQLDQLKKELEWGVPCLPDFNITANGVIIPKRSVVTYCTEYDVDAEIDGVGRISGSIYYKDKAKLDTTGVFIYVDGRAVGDPHSFQEHMANVMIPRTLGMIHANGLRDQISFDRLRFKEDSPEYLAVKDSIHAVLLGVRQDIESGGASSSRRFWSDKTRLMPKITAALKGAEAKLNGSLVAQGKQPYRLEMFIDDSGEVMARYDPAERTIYVNAANPQLSTQKTMNMRDILEPRFLGIAFYTLAEAQLPQDEHTQEVLRRLHTNSLGIADELFQGMSPIASAVRSSLAEKGDFVVPVKDLALNNFRLYIVEEISYLTGLDVNTVKGLHISGTMPPAREGRIKKYRKQTILDTLTRIEGLVPAGKVLDRKNYTRRMHIYHGRPTQELEDGIAQDNSRPDYLLDIGQSRPFLFVPTEKVSHFRRWYRERRIAK